MVSPRLPCPVCVGVLMDKEHPEDHPDVELDLCPRCGGMWFDAGEVQLLRAGSRLSAPPMTSEPHAQRCHSCGAILSRDESSCAACGYKNVLACPSCGSGLQRAVEQGVVLDACRACKGIWFDAHEIAAIWTLALAGAVASTEVGRNLLADAGAVSLDVGSGVLEALMYSPELGEVIVEGAVHAAGAAAEVLAHAPELLAQVPELAELMLQVAGTVFEALVKIVLAVLEGL